MRNTPDPSVHRERERRLLDHVEGLLLDERLRVDTIGGRRPVASFTYEVRKEDREVELKRAMSDLGRPDRELQSRMPLGRSLTVTLSRRFLFLFKATMGRLRIVCMPPWRELIEGGRPEPIGRKELEEALARETTGGVPTTLVLLSTSGFAGETHDLAERRADRTVILVEPNNAGGWTVTGPAETKSVVDLFDPELDADKRQRVREAVARDRADLIGGGLSADRVAAATSLPLQMVEDELRAYAGENEGFVARRLDGRVVLYRESGAAGAVGGSQMPFIQKLKAMLTGKADNERKISLLAERRAALSVQRDQTFEEMGVLENREQEFREQFKATTSTIARKRITSQLVQLRKDLERRQQLLGVLNQQVNVISTHLHNLELVQQGQSAQMPDAEELASDAAAAEEVLAELQANSEIAGSMSAGAGTGLSQEEQELYEELEREAAGQTPSANAPETPEASEPARRNPQAAQAEPPPVPTRERRTARGEAEPG